jgi:hypothetical protein
MFAVLRLLGALLLLAILAAPARAQVQYQATFVDQCCYLTLESGEVAGGQYFVFANPPGAPTWNQSNFKLGASNPRDRSSSFATSSWLSPTRAARLNVQAVAGGQQGRFDFSVKAPTVGSTTVFEEYFEPLGEAESWTGALAYLRYTVVPSLPPSVGLSSVPVSVNRAGQLDVLAEATDNHAIHRVEFALGGKTYTAYSPEADGRTFRLSVPADEIPAGTHTLIARAVDRVGNFATATAAVSFTLADRDGDGSLEDTDCNDRAPLVKPGASEIPGNGVDENCDGVDGRPLVTATVQNQWVASTRTTRVTTLKVRGAPAGARVEIWCGKRGCPFRKRAFYARGGVLDLRKQYFRKARLRVGTTVEIRILVPGHIGKVARFTMRKRRTPLTAYLCLPPGATKPTRVCA